jgi:hypothetical protein
VGQQSVQAIRGCYRTFTLVNLTRNGVVKCCTWAWLCVAHGERRPVMDPRALAVGTAGYVVPRWAERGGGKWLRSSSKET